MQDDKLNQIKFSEYLISFSNNLTSEKVSLRKAVEYFENKGLCFLLMIFSLPTAIPVPYPPGSTIIVGLPLIILSFQMLCGKKVPVLPKWILSFEVKTSLLTKLIIKIIPYLQKIEKLAFPRILIMSSLSGEKFTGFFCLISSFFITSPLLFAHTIPAIGVLIMSFGLLNKDGLIIIIGILISILGLVIALAVLYYTIIGSKLLLQNFKISS